MPSPKVLEFTHSGFGFLTRTCVFEEQRRKYHIVEPNNTNKFQIIGLEVWISEGIDAKAGLGMKKWAAIIRYWEYYNLIILQVKVFSLKSKCWNKFESFPYYLNVFEKEHAVMIEGVLRFWS